MYLPLTSVVCCALALTILGQQARSAIIQNWDSLPGGVEPVTNGVAYSLGDGWTASCSANAVTERSFYSIGAPNYTNPVFGSQCAYVTETVEFNRDIHSASMAVFSPKFTLSASGGAMTMNVSGGNNGSTAPTTIAGIGTTLAAAEDGWQGVLLLDESGNVLQSLQRSSVGEDFQTLSFDTSLLSVGTVYQVAAVDTYFGGWGWIALDEVTIEYATAVPESASLGLLGAASLLFFRRRVGSRT